MTIVKVVDASALAAIIFEEPERDAVISRLEGCTLHAPFLLEYEIASVCIKKIRRDSENADKYLQAAGMLPRFGISFSPVGARMVAELAMHRNLSAYDPSYLWLSQTLSAELVTLDAQLEKARVPS